jgi:hypothetical protein
MMTKDSVATIVANVATERMRLDTTVIDKLKTIEGLLDNVLQCTSTRFHVPRRDSVVNAIKEA